MFILGISCFYHDSAAAILKDGVLLAAAEEERFSRRKHDNSFPEHAVRFCLETAGIGPEDLDYVVFYEKSLPKFERIMTTLVSTFPKSMTAFREAMITWFSEKLWIKDIIRGKTKVPRDRIIFVEHHLSHAASAFFCSPFEESAVMTVDGVGEWTTATLGMGKADWGDGARRNEIQLFSESRFPHSLGLFYSAFTAFLGFEVNDGEYKVMGMAPYGEPKYIDKIRKVIEVGDDGSFWLNMDYFSFHYSMSETFSSKFADLWGEPRKPNDDFCTRSTGLLPGVSDAMVKQNEYYADVAASVQTFTEQTIVTMAKALHARTGSKKLAFAGGVAYNSVANGRILNETPFEEIYIQPAAGDSGGAVGAALYAYHAILQKPREFIMQHAYWGQAFDQGRAKQAVEALGLSYEIFDNDEKLLDLVAEQLAAGKVIGWSQGRFEWGPRALGNRSIIADPRRSEMKDVVNTKIKFREPFRPFAPSIQAEATERYFNVPGGQSFHPGRFMLAVLPVNPEQQDAIPAVSHLGTGRLQMVYEDTNPRYHGLIRRFGEATGVPVVLNTSFNLRGEPIVTTPENALHTFTSSGLDLLVLDSILVRKD
ncbi:MAG: carbamoyltransferase [Chloroflexota bacterium]